MFDFEPVESYHFTLNSGNRKTGVIPVYTSSKITCPTSCPHLNTTCYARYAPMAFHWNKVSKGLRGMSFKEFCQEIKTKVFKGQFWRYSQAGDLPGKGDTLDIAKLKTLVSAQKGKRGYTYTHKPLNRPSELNAVKKANLDGFTINKSTDSLKEADKWKAKGLPVITVVPDFETMPKTTPDGNKLIPCPEQTHNVKCLQCQLCYKADRKGIITFKAIGESKKRIVERYNK